ncbi:MAG: permease-like cell division protein FtsX [Bacilli bacterium]|nr:permease-like cell division protein FtsX [Bacilli bacterium]MBQ6282918.1 permease-like cell division protein FtsX [Bacilli bacterium]
MKLFRLLGRSVRDAFKSVFRNFSLSLASISSVTITLLIVAVSMVLSYNIENISTLIKKDFSIVVFVENDATAEEIEEIEDKIKNMDNVDSYIYETKEQVAESWKKSSDTFKAIIESWDKEENPLADTFSIKVKNLEDINNTAKQIKKINKISLVRYGEGIVEQLLSVLKVIEKFLIGMVLALVLVTIFLVSNTIKITIFSRRKEIEIMRLVGASNSNIKMPFVIEGLFLGLLGSLIPILATIYGYSALYNFVHLENISPFLQLATPSPFIYIISLILLLIGTIVGMFGSAGSVRKYLKI